MLKFVCKFVINDGKTAERILTKFGKEIVYNMNGHISYFLS